METPGSMREKWILMPPLVTTRSDVVAPPGSQRVDGRPTPSDARGSLRAFVYTTPQRAPGINRAEYFVRCGAAALSILVVRLNGPAPFLAETESRNPCKLAQSRRPKTDDVDIDSGLRSTTATLCSLTLNY